MKALVQFDAYAMDYEIKGEIGMLNGIDGVTSVTLLKKKSGTAPQFCVEIELADDKADGFADAVKRYTGQYAGQVSNTNVILYAPV